MPALSVLLPVRNALPWLDASLASLRRQTFADFEIVAIDDGSTDGSGERLDHLARGERRLRVFHTEARGLPEALNLGLSKARGTWIARHDADDLSHRRRFDLQRSLLESDQGTAVVGSRLRMFPMTSTGVGMRRWARWHNTLLTHEAMACEVLIDSPIAHGTAMLRRAWLERVGGWHERGWPEDLDLWIRLFRAGARFAKRPETLYSWRQHRSNATRRDPRYHRQRFIDLKLEALRLDFLRGARRATVLGVGTSLARARAAIATLGLEVESREAGRPHARVLASLAPPAVLVFMSPEARRRWRTALTEIGWRELQDFIFVT